MIHIVRQGSPTEQNYISIQIGFLKQKSMSTSSRRYKRMSQGCQTQFGTAKDCFLKLKTTVLNKNSEYKACHTISFKTRIKKYDIPDETMWVMQKIESL